MREAAIPGDLALARKLPSGGHLADDLRRALAFDVYGASPRRA